MLQQTYADVQMIRMKRAIDTYTRRCKDRPEDIASKAKLDQLVKLLSDYEIKEFRRRSAASPEDTNLHYQLGLCLARAGLHDEAIGEFQQARSSPTLKVQGAHPGGALVRGEQRLQAR